MHSKKSRTQNSPLSNSQNKSPSLSPQSQSAVGGEEEVPRGPSKDGAVGAPHLPWPTTTPSPASTPTHRPRARPPRRWACCCCSRRSSSTRSCSASPSRSSSACAPWRFRSPASSPPRTSAASTTSPRRPPRDGGPAATWLLLFKKLPPRDAAIRGFRRALTPASVLSEPTRPDSRDSPFDFPNRRRDPPDSPLDLR